MSSSSLLSHDDILNIRDFVVLQFYDSIKLFHKTRSELDQSSDSLAAKKVYRMLSLLYHPDKCSLRDLPINIGINYSFGGQDTAKAIEYKKQVCNQLFKELGKVYDEFLKLLEDGEARGVRVPKNRNMSSSNSNPEKNKKSSFESFWESRDNSTNKEYANPISGNAMRRRAKQSMPPKEKKIVKTKKERDEEERQSHIAKTAGRVGHKIHKGWKDYLYDPSVPLGRAFLEEIGVIPTEEIVFESDLDRSDNDDERDDDNNNDDDNDVHPVKDTRRYKSDEIGFRVFKRFARSLGLNVAEAREVWPTLEEEARQEYKTRELEENYEPLIKEYLKDIGVRVADKSSKFM